MTRSPEWPKAERLHLLREPMCACCAIGQHTGAKVQVHHKFPFHYCVALGRPDLELDQRNLITLCETEAGFPCDNHHLLVGHLDDFESSNLTAEVDARETFHGMSADAVKADPRWQARVRQRQKPLAQMTDGEKADFKKLMDETFPQ